MSVTPITEASNLISEGIDVEQPTGIVSILQKCDAEIFEGYEDYKRTFNELQDFRRQPELFRYCLAGGDKALFTSQEAPEDDPNAGIEALKRASEGKTKVVYIGITCGLSAPYVAGQLDFCLDHPDRFIPVLLGFNPEKLARNNPIDKWDKTFMQVVNRLKERMDSGTTAYILNPVVGPEPITGSSRMKGGTATKVLLETVCLKALFDATHSTENMSVRSMIECYRAVCDAVYSKRDALAQVVNMAGEGWAKSDIFDHVFRIDMPLNVLNELIGQETTTTANQMFREIARLGKLDHDTALEYLLRSIYDTDHVTDHIRDLPIAQHILTATPRSKIVPVALVAAVTGSSVEEARKRLDEQPVIRTAIVQALASASKRSYDVDLDKTIKCKYTLMITSMSPPIRFYDVSDENDRHDTTKSTLV
ncbi:GCKR-like protein [Mya arenaria]|uniref:GCKR-like protein n=1 Tax=Mya arenaria TaxID=6604 RepID=A0ABY7FSI2_MYAAR|nr:GCKR-like protein [Mya arenaria]